MTKKSPTIVFFGSGPVAARSLSLLAQDFEVEAVITKPSTLSEMSTITEAPTYATGSKKELDELFEDTAFTSPLAILIDFGIIVSQTVIDYFPKGIINSHFSLLPQWRGADPITFSILSGQEQTGVSLMLLVEAMDEGPLLAQTPYNIQPAETTPSLTTALIELSYQSLKKTLPLWLGGQTQPASQEAITLAPREPTYSRKLTKEDGIIDWHKSAEQIEREIRAFIEWPKSRTSINSLDVVITSSKVVKQQIEPCGKFWVENKQLFVSCGKDSLEILTLKPAGKRDMTAQAFLAGYGHRITK
jgi:methionyl-tRNA formyltransferase